MNKGSQFLKNSNISGISYRLDTSSEKFLNFVLSGLTMSGLKLKDLAITAAGTKNSKFVKAPANKETLFS